MRKDTPILSLENITKSFENLEIFSEVNLNLMENDCLALIGANGTGKTTLLQVISGLLEPTKGKVKSYNKKIEHHNFAYAAEELWLYPDLTVKENILYFGNLYNIPTLILSKKALYLIEISNLKAFENTLVKKLSHGTKRRLNIVISLIHDPKIILLDEPFLGLDIESLDTIKKIIRELKNMGKAFIISTHKLDDIEEFCDKLAILHDKKLIIDNIINKKEELKDKEVLEINTYEKYDFTKFNAIEKNNRYFFLVENAYELLEKIRKECNPKIIKEMRIQKVSIEFLYYYHTGEKFADNNRN